MMSEKDTSKRAGAGLKISIAMIVVLILGVGLGFLLDSETARDVAHQHEGEAEVEAPEFWTCSMHPQVRQPEPGQCPICAMDLIPVESGGGEDVALDPNQIHLTPNAIALAEVRTAKVERKFVTATVRMVGKVAYDESRVGHITAWVGGRVDRLFADTTGMPVRKGDHMVQLYSPDLLTAQEEFLQAAESLKRLSDSSSDVIRRSARTNLDAAREKLELLGLAESQIESLRESGKASDEITIYAPTGGIVVERLVNEGAYVQTGTRIYTVADLSRVWLVLDAYESDLGKLRYGQKVTFEVEAFPGETFDGQVSFISPVLNQMKRTVDLRVSVANPDGRLRPGMFANAMVEVVLGQSGVVGDPALKDKWVCPMHPEIVKDEPSACDICEMPLTRVENLGYLNPGEEQQPALVVPVSSVLQTGKRAVVYLKVPDQDGVYEGREITVGPKADDYFIVESGLSEGDVVVERGAFKIDSAMQILAKPSMMNPGSVSDEDEMHDHAGTTTKIETPEAFDKQLTGLYNAYYKIQEALSQDDADAAAEVVNEARAAFAGVDMTLLAEEPHMAWMVHHRAIDKALEELDEASGIESQRAAFALLSDAMTAAAREFGGGLDASVLVYQCPMAFNNRGAIWLQDKAGTENPYFGSAMFACGDQIEVIKEMPDENEE